MNERQIDQERTTTTNSININKEKERDRDKDCGGCDGSNRGKSRGGGNMVIKIKNK